MGFSFSSIRFGYLKLTFLLLVSSILFGFFATPVDSSALKPKTEHGCSALKHFHDYQSKCAYLKTIDPCAGQGLIDYLSLLYCNFEKFPLLGQSLLFLWLLALFYVLGHTASEYFCSSLESLSKLLKLSPTVAGVTLLSLGNGAPDLFASLVSFMGESKGTYDVGLNTVVGGSSFVTCVVVGIISISLRSRRVRIERSAFIRDVCFFCAAIGSLGLILVYGKINLWGALGFCSLYAVYVAFVYLSWRFGGEGGEFDLESVHKRGSSLSEPILQRDDLVHDERVEDVVVVNDHQRYYLKLVVWVMTLPIYLPRTLTIPVVSEAKWSKPTAVASVTLAPVLLSFLWNWKRSPTSFEAGIVYLTGCLIGIALGLTALATTKKSNPPKKWLLPWLAGGFVMSMTWSYISAQELVALLTSLGYIFGVSPSILGLTVLAWGNSIGDLITNVTMALHDGDEGAQVAVSGCYAGPIFNTLFALGISLVGCAWEVYPTSIVIKTDPRLLESLGFLVIGLVWSFLVLFSNRMRLGGVMGVGLLVIYLVSLSIRIVQTVGDSY
ncbi:Cation/calcium exchanger 2 [Raphanus sativus]|uniref:Cation/calcium exchanger 2 n=1 Tax=Raphanus sativus TaxID=3726 RepID=A0A6J0K7V3_RAPSA|nr:cation/calcium exchanger 2 [Raphanus sativus]XP_018444078.2 cation/calcium exchanger 2 [Raphanus sativus]KAJ4910650.1 Cation/calcium exchanger 2 [Raphanus sativus]